MMRGSVAGREGGGGRVKGGVGAGSQHVAGDKRYNQATYPFLNCTQVRRGRGGKVGIVRGSVAGGEGGGVKGVLGQAAKLLPAVKSSIQATYPFSNRTQVRGGRGL